MIQSKFAKTKIKTKTKRNVKIKKMPNGNTTRVIWQYKENHQIILIDRKHFANGIPVYQINYSGQ